MHTDESNGLFNVFGADGLEVTSFTGERFLLIAERMLDEAFDLPLNFSINRISADGALVEERTSLSMYLTLVQGHSLLIQSVDDAPVFQAIKA